ncbi:MAG TPA: hypothetical protein VFE54_13835, partial [Mucilaginibacter sp.]|nr:hypothetical protein [Mucilaginibacter sp.]
MKFRLPALAIFSLCLFVSNRVSAQKDSVDQKRWSASWIDVPGPQVDYEYCLFRKTLNLASKPSTFVVK